MIIVRPKVDTKEVTESKETKLSESPTTRELQVQTDWPFMQESEEVLTNIPDTWKAYPNTMQGKCDIIDMEYCELQKAMTIEEKRHELVHLASACLYLWRELIQMK